jgi:hypothetical protein
MRRALFSSLLLASCGGETSSDMDASPDATVMAATGRSVDSIARVTRDRRTFINRGRWRVKSRETGAFWPISRAQKSAAPA